VTIVALGAMLPSTGSVQRGMLMRTKRKAMGRIIGVRLVIPTKERLLPASNIQSHKVLQQMLSICLRFTVNNVLILMKGQHWKKFLS
jgi:hypothetical protein